MKHVNNQRSINILLYDTDNKANYAHETNDGRHFVGNIRLNLGLYRTPEEVHHYIRKSLKRKLP